MRILMGYDGTPASDRLFKDLESAGLPAESQALVLVATMPWPMPGYEARGTAPFSYQAREIEKEALQSATLLADRAAKRLRRRIPTWSVVGKAALGRPAETLLRTAESWKADLIVVGARSRSALGRMLLGSVSQRVLQHALEDVRIVRNRTREPRSGAARILIAVDGSPGSDQAVAAVARRTWPKGSRARVVAVVDWRVTPSPLLKPMPSWKEKNEISSLIEVKAEEAVRILSQAGLKASYAVLFGVPSRVLVEECGKWKADAIFLGSRGINAVERFLLGSVAGAVAARAPCSVEVVRSSGKEPRARARRKRNG